MADQRHKTKDFRRCWIKSSIEHRGSRIKTNHHPLTTFIALIVIECFLFAILTSHFSHLTSQSALALEERYPSWTAKKAHSPVPGVTLLRQRAARTDDVTPLMKDLLQRNRAQDGTGKVVPFFQRILLADNRIAILGKVLESLQKQMPQAHFEVARNRKEALEKLQAAQSAGRPFDLVVTDLKMGSEIPSLPATQKQGGKLIADIRRATTLKQPYIVVLTAGASSEESTLRKLGADAVVDKELPRDPFLAQRNPGFIERLEAALMFLHLVREFQIFKYPEYRENEYQALLDQIETTEEALGLKNPSERFMVTTPDGFSFEVRPYHIPVASEKSPLPLPQGLTALAKLVTQKQRELNRPVRVFTTGRPGTGKTMLSDYLLKEGLGQIRPEEIEVFHLDDSRDALTAFEGPDEKILKPETKLVLLDGIAVLTQPDLVVFLEADEKRRWYYILQRPSDEVAAFVKRARQLNIRWRQDIDLYRNWADLIIAGDIPESIKRRGALDGGKKTWVDQHTPELKGKTIVEVTMEMAFSDGLLKRLEKSLKEDSSLTDAERDELMRAAAMATSVGGIGPLLKERVIAQGDFGANVIGVSLLYDKVWMQRTQKNGLLIQELMKVTPHLRKVLEYDRELTIEMYDGQWVKVKVWRAPKGTYGKGTVYFFDIPSVTDVIGGRANVAYPGGIDVAERAEEARDNQSWILGRGTLALMKALGKKPDLIVMSEVASSFAHHRLFQDRLSTDPYFDETRYGYQGHTPLKYARPGWSPDKLKRLRVNPLYYENLPVWKDGDVDAETMIVNVVDTALGVSEKHGWMMKGIFLLKAFKDKIFSVTNGVSPRYWPQKAFRNLKRIAALSNNLLLAMKQKEREAMIRWLARRQGNGGDWVEEAIRGQHPIGLWTRRVVEYKRLERLGDLLSDPAMRERFLKTGIILVIGGRIHQDDPYGHIQYHRLYQLLQGDPDLKKRIIFFENYNIWEAPRLFQGADFSIMLADSDREASATGFQKMQMNGGLIIASHDGAVPESVTFYNGHNEDGANGFNVPYDSNGTPMAEGLLQAFEQFSQIFKDKTKLGKMVRNALTQAPRVSINRTAQEMLTRFSDVMKRSASEETAYAEGRLLANSILKDTSLSPEEARNLLGQLNAYPLPFVWKYREGNVREKIIYTSQPGLAGLLKGWHEVRALGTVGLWSLSFHSSNPKGGDPFIHLNNLIRKIPILRPIRMELLRRAREVHKLPTDATDHRLYANRVALGLAEGLLTYLEEVSQAKDGFGKALPEVKGSVPERARWMLEHFGEHLEPDWRNTHQPRLPYTDDVLVSRLEELFSDITKKDLTRDYGPATTIQLFEIISEMIQDARTMLAHVKRGDTSSQEVKKRAQHVADYLNILAGIGPRKGVRDGGEKEFETLLEPNRALSRLHAVSPENIEYEDEALEIGMNHSTELQRELALMAGTIHVWEISSGKIRILRHSLSEGVNSVLQKVTVPQDYPHILKGSDALSKYRLGLVTAGRRWRRGIPRMSPSDIEKEIEKGTLIVIQTAPERFILSRPPEHTGTRALDPESAVKVLQRPGANIHYEGRANIENMSPNDKEDGIRRGRIFVREMAPNWFFVYAAHPAAMGDEEGPMPEASEDDGSKKNTLIDDLWRAVRTQNEKRHEKLLEWLRKRPKTWVWIIPAKDNAPLGEIPNQIQSIAEGLGIERESSYDLALASSELIGNTIFHAEGGVFIFREIEREGRSAVELIALDRGAGIPEGEGILTRGLPPDLLAEGGRGFFILNAMKESGQLDDIRIDSKPSGGAKITIFKWISSDRPDLAKDGGIQAIGPARLYDASSVLEGSI